MSIQPGNRMRGRALAVVLATGLVWPALAPAWAAPVQAAAAPAPGSRVSGTVTAIAGSVLTVKDDKGTESKVTVPDSARVLQLPPGAKSLSAATPIKVSDIAVGDRILAKTTPDGSNYTASTLVAMKQADVAKVQQSELQDWKTKGVNGIVRSVDSAAQTVTISTGNGPTAKTIVIQASKTTNIRRYAPDSTKFDDAKAVTLDQIKPGDQLRAKGDKNADGTELAADAIVAGTFRNIAGTVVSVDASANKVVVNDLVTKKPFTVDVNVDSQLHKLSPMMAQGIAMRLKGGGAGAGAPGAAPGGAAGSGSPTASSGGAGQSGGAGGGASASQGHAAGANGGPPTAAGSGALGQRGGDVQQMLNRAPVLELAELKKGDAIMVLTTEGQAPGEATAVTLLAGVEPLLQASPSASQSVLSASWNLGGGAVAAGQDAQ
jgi:transcription antitermination factor NusG